MSFFIKLGLIIPRIFLGGYLAFMGIDKIQDAGWPDEFRHELDQWASERSAAEAPLYQPESLYQGLQSRVAARVETVAELVRWGELILGAMILVGLFHPLALLAQIVYSVSLLLLAGHHSAALEQSHMAFAVMGIALFLTRAGRYCGVDSFLHERWGDRFLGRMVC